MDHLYHYCTTDSFFSIVSTRSIWLSSLLLSNDTMEGRIVNDTIMRLAGRDQLSEKDLAGLRDGLAFLERTFHGLGFCLSEKGDLLSQWRGYADDGRGISIAFKRRYLDELVHAWHGRPNGLALYKVEYEPVVHEKLLEATYQELLEVMRRGAFTGGLMLSSLLSPKTPEEQAKADEKLRQDYQVFYAKLLTLFPKLYQLKGNAFKEEAEWRLVSLLIGEGDHECEFRPRGARLVPYRKFDLPQLHEACIEEVVLGPRHETPTALVQALLNKAGFGDVRVRPSIATYR